MKRDTFHRVWVAALAAALAAGCPDDMPPSPGSGGPESMRILSLTPNVTEILFAMGLGDRVVGRSNYCTVPPEALKVPAVGDTLSINLEKVISLKPTLALVVTKRPEIATTLEGLGIPTVRLKCDTMPELMETIQAIGRETHTGEASATLSAWIRENLEAVRRRVQGRTRPKVLVAFPMTVGSAQMMVAGRGTFIDELIGVAGGENAYPAVAEWPTVTPAKVIAMAPDVVIINAVGGDAAPDRVQAIQRAWQQWATVPAVRKARVHVLTAPFLTIPGPRVGMAAECLADLIHPDAARQEDTTRSAEP